MKYKDWSVLQRGDVIMLGDTELVITNTVEYSSDNQLYLCLFTNKGWMKIDNDRESRYLDYERTGFVNLPRNREIDIRC